MRVDLKLIAEMIDPYTRVLDIGCGDGELLDYLHREKQVDGRGIELSMSGVRTAVAQGLSVIQGDADTDLKDFPSQSFDWVILGQTLQATRDPKGVLGHMLRIGKRAIVSFPNFGFWRIRIALLFGGRMPITETLNAQWYDTPNIHLCTIQDFMDLCHSLDIRIEKSYSLDRKGEIRRIGQGVFANLFGEQAIFQLCSKS
jgi:methionine biosynthesis protein MetW